MTPVASILTSSVATLGLRGKAMLRSVDSVKGCESELSLITNSSPRFPSLLKASGNCRIMSVFHQFGPLVAEQRWLVTL